MQKKNLWILTEERPKTSVISSLLDILKDDCNLPNKHKKVVIEPVIKKGKFQFVYAVKGVCSKVFNKVYIKIVSGSSSFIDYLVCLQENAPIEGDCSNVLIAVEETKTSDKESRNTGVSQRASKFIYAKQYCPNAKLYMLYNEELENNEDKKPSDTNIFGTNILLTLGVKIIGKSNLSWFKAFNTIDEIISFKNGMREPPEGNVPIKIVKNADFIEVSGRLAKPKDAGNIAHDPSIGGLSMICGALRKLGWENDIVITKHATSQEYVDRNRNNKFLYLCKLLNLKMQGLNIVYPESYREKYWYYECSSEKVASILLHIMGMNAGLRYIYENHAGCERGYFRTTDEKLVTLPKKDANGNNLLIPDVVLADMKYKNIYLIEGKQLSTLRKGLEEIEDYDSIENEYIIPEYPNFKYLRYLSIFGGDKTELPNRKIMLYLNADGLIIINKDLPKDILKRFKKIRRG